MLVRTKKFLLESMILCVCIAMCGYGVFWVYGHIQEKRENMDIARAQEEIIVEKIQQKGALEKEHAFVSEKEGMLREVFLDEGSVIAAIEQLESLAQRKNISVEINILDNTGKKQVVKKTNPAKTEDENNQNKVTFLVKTSGTYEETIAYFESLERMLPIASFEGVTMRKNENNTTVPQEQKTVPSEGEEESAPEVQKKEVISELTISFLKFPEVKT